MSRTTVPIGPQHPLLKEPLSLRLEMEAERVVSAALRVGYVHRGIEKLCQRRTYVQNVHLVERICGICSQAHTTTFCQAVEALHGAHVPRRAAYIRVLLCELERIHSHLLWLGVLCEAVGFTTLWMYTWRDREIILDLLEELSGGRVSHGVNVVGGVRVDVDHDQAERVRRGLGEFSRQLDLFREVLDRDHSLQIRTEGLAPLSAEGVRAMGLVGPTARASGCTFDVRRDQPYAAYPWLRFSVISATEGDVWSRAQVRLGEIGESLSLCLQALDDMPPGPLTVGAPRRVPTGEAVVRIEAPRGELLYYVRGDGSDRPARVKVRTPTLPVLQALGGMLEGVEGADVSAIVAGADLCIACADR